MAHWDFFPKFLSLHYYTTLEGVLGVKRSGQAHGTIICLFELLFFSQNGMTFKKPTKIIKIQWKVPSVKDRVMKQRQKRLGDYYILLISVGHLFCVITAETLLTLSQKEKESLPPCDDPPKHVRQSVSDSKSCTMNDKYENFGFNLGGNKGGKLETTCGQFDHSILLSLMIGKLGSHLLNQLVLLHF